MSAFVPSVPFVPSAHDSNPSRAEHTARTWEHQSTQIAAHASQPQGAATFAEESKLRWRQALARDWGGDYHRAAYIRRYGEKAADMIDRIRTAIRNNDTGLACMVMSEMSLYLRTHRRDLFSPENFTKK